MQLPTSTEAFPQVLAVFLRKPEIIDVATREPSTVSSITSVDEKG